MKVQWDEPVEFIRDYLQSIDAVPTRRSRVWAAVITAVVVDGLILAFWSFFYLLHNKDLGVPSYTYVVAPAIAGVFVYILPVMMSSSRCVIVLTEKGIHRNKNFGSQISMQLWPWDSITELTVEEVRFGETVHRVLVVHSSLDPNDTLLGLGDAPMKPIEDAIARMGKTMVYKCQR